MFFNKNKVLKVLIYLESKALALVLVSVTKAKALDSKEKIKNLVCQCVSPIYLKLVKTSWGVWGFVQSG